jgi:hypothetical protein
VDFHIREITQGSKKKTYGPYEGYIEKLKEPIELKGRVIKYKPIAKLSRKTIKKIKGGVGSGPNGEYIFNDLSDDTSGIHINNKDVILSNRMKEKQEGFERKQKIQEWRIETEKQIKEIQNNKRRVEEEEARKKKIETEKELEVSRLYDILLKKVKEFYKNLNYFKKNYRLIIDKEKFIILQYSINTYFSIFLTIDRKTLDYCAFRITVDNQYIIISKSNNIEEFISNLNKALMGDNRNFQKLVINENFYELFPRMYIRNKMDMMKKGIVTTFGSENISLLPFS